MWYKMTKGGTEEKNAYKILVTETEMGKPLDRTKSGWKEKKNFYNTGGGFH
jgi:hypothetical protein